jgi:hypothetical protein
VDTAFSEGDCFSGYDRMEPLDFPPGSAIVVHVDNECDPQHKMTLYSIASWDQAGEVRCIASERPDDDWLSIAETFEFLPAEE